MEKKPLSTTLLIGISLVAAGALIFISCFTVMFTYQKTDAAVTVCERHEEYDEDVGTVIKYYIDAEYTVNGETYTAHGTFSYLRDIGEKVGIYYHKADPKVYKFKSNIDSRAKLGLMLSIIGAVIVAANIFRGVEIKFSED